MITGISEEGAKVQKGEYIHYKGGRYEVIGVGHHTETEEELVFYKTLDEKTSLWVRPVSMFCETIEINGVPTPRFRYLGRTD